jgi:hypothetical protein
MVAYVRLTNCLPPGQLLVFLVRVASVLWHFAARQCLNESARVHDGIVQLRRLRTRRFAEQVSRIAGVIGLLLERATRQSRSARHR